MNNFHKITCLSLLLFCGLQVKADEGMWPVSGLNSALISKMYNSGLKMSAEQIYDENKPSLKDAVLLFDNGGTAEFVSANGLIFTNHHCGRDRVQQVSDSTKNYLRDGYWATSQSEEIPIKGLTVKMLVKTKDVTAEALELLKTKGLRKVMFELEKQYSDTVNGYTASLDHFSTGKYLISVYEVFSDVRLVGVPPECIGNFGGETDNFEWPRHSADFSVFRVYANSKNMPAEYSKDNKPYVPKKYLPVKLSGIHENDFTMTIGYPFQTERHISSFALKDEMEVKERSTVLTKGLFINVLERAMNKDENIRLKYSNKNFSAGNSYKLALGTMKLVNLSSAMKDKQKEETEFQKWAENDSSRFNKYGSCLKDLEKYYGLQHNSKYAQSILTGALFNDASLIGIRIGNLIDELGKKDSKISKNALNVFNNWYQSFSKDYDIATDREITKAMLHLVKREVNKEYLPDIYSTIDSKYQGNIDNYVDDMYSKTIFSSKAKIEKFLKKPNGGISKDPLYVYGQSVYNKMIDVKKAANVYGVKIRKAENLYEEGLREKNAGMLTYPEANFTMRMTYGKVEGANPRDGIAYRSQTTLKGVIEKEDSTQFDFLVSPRLKMLYNTRDFGRYGENGEMYTCFLATTDIAGGNSGSPVVNGEGELTGIAFDGNWESLASSIVYEPAKNRSINVDIRYVLFIIDKFAKSNYILNELTINN